MARLPGEIGSSRRAASEILCGGRSNRAVHGPPGSESSGIRSASNANRTKMSLSGNSALGGRALAVLP